MVLLYPFVGEADLLEAIQLVIQKYRSKSIPSPSIAQNVPLKTAAADFAKSEPLQLIAVQSGESDLLQTIQRIQQQSTIPIFSGEADLVQFIEQIKVLHPDLSSSQLSAIITGEANSILQIFNQKSQQNQKNGIPIVSGSADLLEAIEFVFQKYRNQSHVYPLPFRSATTYAQSVPVQSQVNVRFFLNPIRIYFINLKVLCEFNFRLFNLHSRIRVQTALAHQFKVKKHITSNRTESKEIISVAVSATEKQLLIPLSRISKVNFPISARNQRKVKSRKMSTENKMIFIRKRP